MNISTEDLRKLAASFREQAKVEHTVKCAQVIEALTGLEHLQRLLTAR